MIKAVKLRPYTQDLADRILASTMSLLSQDKSKILFHQVEHAGYGAILSRLMTGLNRSLELNTNYSFKINSPYIIESIFDIPNNQSSLNNRSSDGIVEWNFFKDTWNKSQSIRANHLFPKCPLSINAPAISRHQWCAVLAKAICGKPLPLLQNVIDLTKKDLGWSNYEVIIGLHVRRGDKNTEVPYIPTQTYLDFLEKVLAKHINKKIAVFLASDDPDCYEEFKTKLFDKDICILWDENENRFNNYNAEMVKNSLDLATQESVTAAKNISLLGDCDYVIGMASAQFTWIGGLLSVFNHALDTSRHIMIDANTGKQSHWACAFNIKAEKLLTELELQQTIKVLHISPDENGGGAAKAAYRIHNSLRPLVQSEMLVLRKQTNDQSVRSIQDTLLGKIKRKLYKTLNRSRNKLDSDFQTNNTAFHSFGKSGYGLVNQINKSDADLVHLHWISGMLSIEDIARIKKPIVWTMHDMWAICGGEHYVPDDSPSARFRVGYLANNRPNYESGPDLNKITWDKKLLNWENKHFSIVGCSNWLAKCAIDSPLFKRSQIYAINFPLDVKNIWVPHSKTASRELFGLPKDKKLILAGAVGGVNNFYKGGDLLKESLSYLGKSPQDDFEVILFGQEVSEKFNDWPLPVHNLGKLTDPVLLAKLYSCVDVAIMPSRQEAFGQIASEAQACGVPVAAFNIGGPIDIIEHQKTGWLSPPYDTQDLAKGIEWIITNPDYEKLSKASRDRAERLFSEEVIGQQYVDVYRQALISQH